MHKQLLDELQFKRNKHKMWAVSNHQQKYKEAAKICREKFRKAKAQNELRHAREI